MRALVSAAIAAFSSLVLPAVASAQVVSFTQQNHSISEAAGSITLRLRRESPTTGTTTVTLGVASPGGPAATVGADFGAPPSSVTFAAGETEKAFVVPILQDTVTEGSEQFAVQITGVTAGGGSVGFPNTAFVQILDDEPPIAVGFSPTQYSFNENAGTVTLTVRRNGGASESTTVSYATVGSTANSPGDYAHASGQLTFAPGESSKTIAVSIVDDALYEGNETFFVQLSGTSGVIVTEPSASIAIQDNEQPSQIRLGASTYSVDEGASALTVAVLRSGNTSGTSQVVYTTNFGGFPAATAGVDYIATSGTLHFAAGETSKSFTVSIVDDFSHDPGETFGIVLTNPGGAELTDPRSAVVTIQDNEQPSIVRFGSATYRVNENAGSLQIAVTRSGSLDQAASVNYSSQTQCCTPASAGVDYQSLSGTLMFAPGEASKTITADIIDDASYEGDEQFRVTLSPGSNAIVQNDTTVVTIVDNEEPTRIAFAQDATSVGESAGALTLSVIRSGSLTGTSTVQYETPCCTPAQSGSDYTAASGTVTFAPGEATKTLTIAILSDAVDEPNETFVVALSNPTGATLQTPAAVTVTILDDDPTITYAFTGTPYRVQENNGTAHVVVERTAGSSNASSITFSVTSPIGATATPGSDFVAENGTLTFAAGETRKTIVITILDDTVLEGNESFFVTISSGTSAMVTIIDDEPLPTISMADTSVVEGDSGATDMTFRIALSAPFPRDVSLNVSAQDVSARFGSDYEMPMTSVTIPAGTTAVDVTFRIRGDVVDEGDESFLVKITHNAFCGCFEPNCCFIPTISRGTAVGTIRNDDFSISVGDTTVAEGNSDTNTATFTVRLSGAMGHTVTVTYATANGTASVGSDFEGRSGTLTFAPGERAKTITVPVIGDTVPEEDETFVLRLLSATGAPISRGTAQATIGNDDEFFTAYRDFEYANAAGHSMQLDLFVPTYGSGPYPVIVWLPGDQWTNVSRAASPAIRQTQRGYAVASISYRTSDQAKFPAQLHDAKAAVRWLRANAARFGLDPLRIGAWGFGSGGHLAALLGTTGDVAALEDLSLGNAGVSSRVQAVVDWAGPIDLLQLQADALPCSTTNHNSSGSYVSLFLGCSVQLCPERAAAANPITYITRDDAPTLIMHGEADCEVSPAQSVAFDRALRSGGVESVLKIVPGLGHQGVYWDTIFGLTEVDAFFDLRLRGGTRRRGAGR